VFLHRVEPGIAEGSYGVHVARLAGLPARVTETADTILKQLCAEAPLSFLGQTPKKATPLPLFGSEDHPVVRKLRKINPDNITPMEALKLLVNLKNQV